MQEKLLVICPSRSRPKLCNEMVDSFLKTQKMSTLKLLLDMDDPCLDEYISLIGSKVPYTIAQRKPVTNIINENWKFSSHCFRWFSVTNDDFIYHTDSWDLKMIGTLKLHGGLGIVYGNDLLQMANMPTTSIISREIPEALGWLQMPLLTHLFGDTVWQLIGSKAQCLHYRADIIIEHRHYFARKADQDDIYKRTNSKEMYDLDTIAYMKWLNENAKEDIIKIQNLVDNNLKKSHK
jgi:hypothetical protein